MLGIEFDFMTRQVFDTLIFVVFGSGLVVAIIRLVHDFTRPLTDADDADDTRPHV